MSLDYYNSLMETVYLLKSPANAAHLAKSISQYKEGEHTQRNLSGFWSRRIDDTNRLVYTVDGNSIVIISCRYYY